MKCIILGDVAVGKTSLMLRFTEGTFTKKINSNFGVDFYSRTVTVTADEADGHANEAGGREFIRMQIWDTCGQERYRTISSSYYRGANGIIIAYDSTDQLSFSKVEEWLSRARQSICHCSECVMKEQPEPVLALVATKTDRDAVVSVAAARELAAKHNMIFMETSSKTGAGVEQIFMQLAEAYANVFGKDTQDTAHPPPPPVGHCCVIL